MAANHMSQSRRRWYGATWGDRRFGSPGFPLNSYAFHVSDGPASSAPSRMIS